MAPAHGRDDRKEAMEGRPEKRAVFNRMEYKTIYKLKNSKPDELNTKVFHANLISEL